MSSRLHTHSKLPKPKISLNRSPQRPKASARRQTNNYITPLSKTLGRNIVPASPKDPPKRGRYLDESNRPGQKPAKPHHRRPNLCGVSLPSAAGSTPQPASSFESPLMAELREQYNKTPSPERLLPRPAMVRFAAIADYVSPLESKQQHQRQQQHLRSRLPVQGTATDSLPPRKLFGRRDAAQSQPLIQSNPRRREVTTSRDMGRDKEEAGSSPVVTSEEALTPMYFTMQYKNSRSHILGPDDDIPLQGLSLAAVQNHDIHDGYKRKVSSRFQRPEANVVETGYLQVDEPRNKPMQDEYRTDLVAQQHHNGQEATLESHIRAQGRLSEDQPISQVEQTRSTTNQQLRLMRRPRNQTCSLRATTEGSPLVEEYTYSHCVESKCSPQAASKSNVSLPGKQASKSLGYIRNLGTRNFSWGNNTSKVANKIEEGGATQVVEKEKRIFMKRTGTVLEKVRKFEALGSGIPKDLQQPKTTYPPLATSGADLLDDKPSGPVLKGWYSNSKLNLRQYFQGKGKELPSEDIAPPLGPSTTQRRQSCAGTEQSNIYNPKTPGVVRRRVSEATENLKLPVSKGYRKKSNPEETYKYQNPDGGRFPPWPTNNSLEMVRKSPVKTCGSSMIDATHRKTDMSLLPLSRETRAGPQSIVRLLRSDAPEGIGSHINDITPNIEPLEWRCSTAYWAGRFSTMRDIMRQEILAMENPSLVCVDDWHQDFVEAVFKRLFASTMEQFSTPNGASYSEENLAYLREYQKKTMEVVAIKARKRRREIQPGER
ncbi:hypothetical protein L211DRAFT_525219 [Terfezia boudieri ATCC MYA-4762]|uniref:Uncharacterized protein n=1 Tax=Terfezia boudieri ATCC MYA-4762 TaxID=1051890 RepID=A0A3N4LCE8_9PEZI|nr:hypothetical protein L211DRAFT_525219 [Terfezia boudieri ATCC MYA-4762]